MKRSYFITATGTDLGKTWLAAGIVATCRTRGAPVRALKPVMSGYDETDPAASDAGILLAKVSPRTTAQAVAEISPWRFAAPLSPDLAAAREGRSVAFDALVDWCRGEIAANKGLLLIEGIGGVMVPLDARHTVRDWIAALSAHLPTEAPERPHPSPPPPAGEGERECDVLPGVQVLLVAGTYLGALSHTLTAVAALREVGVVPAAIVVNESAGSTVSVEDTVSALVPHTGGVPIHALRRNDEAAVARLADGLLQGVL